ncbi:hypothetical protein JXA63_01515 [Candidatus Woesebacteria bacterium]|nr:hypothetical protein [Candidatus Woesebacteria bacterium]
MSERDHNKLTEQKAQSAYEKAGRRGFVVNFIEEGSDDLRFMAMNKSDRELWIRLANDNPTLLDELPFFD